MRRNCLIAAVVWLLLLAAYLYLLRDDIKFPDRLWASLAMATVVWIGTVVATGARFTYRDWKARRALARGERPEDGQLVAAVGTVRPVLETMLSPMTGTECVLYSYDIGPSARSEGKMPKDFVGYGMVRCSVQTPYGQYLLGSFPVLEGVGARRVSDRAMAVEYVGSTNFEQVNFADLARGMFAIHTQAPPLKRDFKFGEQAIAVDEADVQETLIVPGDLVTAYGKYVAAANSIVSDTQEKGYLRVRRGGQARSVPSFPWNAVGQFFGGLAIVVTANVVLWLLLTVKPQ